MTRAPKVPGCAVCESLGRRSRASYLACVLVRYGSLERLSWELTCRRHRSNVRFFKLVEFK